MLVAPGEPGFDEAYQAAIKGEVAAQSQSKTSAGTLAWLIARYRETSAWTELSLATRRQREAIFRQILETAGHEPITRITRKAVVAGRDRRRDTPAQARHYLDTMRGLFRWAVDADFCKDDPTADVRPPKAKRSDGFPVWEPEDVAKFEARWPIGTRARLAFDLLRYTGLRRGDAARLGRQHVRDGVIRIKTAKTGQIVTITVLPALAETLAAGPVGDLAFIVGDRGRPLTKESFGNEFREWCAAAGVTKSAHGLRKLAASVMAENRATVAELESVFGWSGGRMASLYTRSADRERLGRAGSVKLARTGKAQPGKTDGARGVRRDSE
ncbi:tyrosine-type recombinase/integrase [Rhodoplanes sp. SY1]|uniref:tyrosine-type recombinase/integrase n=1 Tax=Rhodoplanes sp. SY1 TaxID=3166646 RepID=UPI0038B5CF82